MFLGILTLLLCAQDGTTLRFSKVYTNHMVLQRGPERAMIWGYANVVGDRVRLIKNNVNVGSAVVEPNPRSSDPAGVWKVKLPAETRPGPFVITAMSSEGNVTLHDVLFGDVWLCSGQSNMYFMMAGVNNSAAEITEGLNHSTIRMLNVGFGQSGVPLDEPAAQDGWVKPLHHHIERFSAVCFLTAVELQKTIHHPMGLIEASVGGTKIELWTPPETLNKCHGGSIHTGRAVNYTATSSLWNAMVHPFVNTTMKGVLWYQGESNSADPNTYACVFRTMYHDWGRIFNEGSGHQTRRLIPFGFVQLSGTKGTTIGLFPQLRWAQTQFTGHVPTPGMPTAFMAVALDLADPQSPHGSIHPRYKHEVAYRLALGARAVAYGEHNVVFQGPYPTHNMLHPTSNELTVEFDANIYVKSNTGFEVCCSHQPNGTCIITKWTNVAIKAKTANTVTLDVSACPINKRHVTGIRYLWRTTPCDFMGCALYGDMELPVPPFIQNINENTPSIIG